MGLFGFFNKNKKETLDKGLEKTKQSVFDKLARAVAGKSKVDDDVLDDLEEVLITSDVGVDTTLKVIRRIEERVQRDKYVSTSELNGTIDAASTLPRNRPNSPRLSNHSILDMQNIVGACGNGVAVRNEKQGPGPVVTGMEAVEQRLFRRRVERRGGLVED